MSPDSPMPAWIRIRLFVGCLAASWSGATLGVLLLYAILTGRPIATVLIENLREGLIVGAALGSLPGLVIGSHAVERLDETRSLSLLWTRPALSFGFALLALFVLCFVVFR